MNFLRPLKVASAAFFVATAAVAQQPGTATSHAFVIGKGAGQAGFTSLLCGSAQLAVGQSAADPVCRTMSGDATLSAAGAISIGATKVTSAMLNADVFSTAHSWSGQQSFVAPILGTPASGTLTNATGLPIATGVAGLGTGVATFLATPSSANLRAALTDESGTGAAYFQGGDLGTPSAGVLTNATGLPVGGVASIPANTLVGNFTGSSASPTATNPASFAHKASPTTSDILIIADAAASNAIKRATIAEVIGAIGSGVTSLNGQTGALSTANGIETSSNIIQLTAARRTLPTIQRFTSGSGTYTTPANALWIEVLLVGGGGGGSGGGSGAPAGSAGGNTCWSTSGAACTTPVSQAAGGAAPQTGGTTTGLCNILAVAGGNGGSGNPSVAATLGGTGGMGGNSSLGGAGAGLYSTAGTAAATNSGSGGGGGGNNSTVTTVSGQGGGAGATCRLIITSPASSYTYAVGVAGGAGAAGANGFNGAAGGAGLIVVLEHYGS